MITHSAVENCEQYDGMKFWLDPHERSVSNSIIHMNITRNKMGNI